MPKAIVGEQGDGCEIHQDDRSGIRVEECDKVAKGAGSYSGKGTGFPSTKSIAWNADGFRPAALGAKGPGPFSRPAERVRRESPSWTQRIARRATGSREEVKRES